MQSDELLKVVLDALEDRKAVDTRVLDVRGKTSITDIMVVTSGTSNRHVKSLADHVAYKAKKSGNPALGVEGEESGEWILVDLVDVVVHVMLPRIREFYQLEKLWEVDAQPATKAATSPGAGDQ